jgi:hypothetical protein
MKQPKCEFQSRSRKATGCDIKGRRCMTRIQPGVRPSNIDPSQPSQKFELHPKKPNAKLDQLSRPPEEIGLALNISHEPITFVGPPGPEKPTRGLFSRFSHRVTQSFLNHVGPTQIQQGAIPYDIESANFIINTVDVAIARNPQKAAPLRLLKARAIAYRTSCQTRTPTNENIATLQSEYYNLTKP